MKNKLREKPSERIIKAVKKQVDKNAAGLYTDCGSATELLTRLAAIKDPVAVLAAYNKQIIDYLDQQAEQIEALEETLTDNCKLIKEQDIEILALKESNNALVRIFEVTDEKSELAIKTIKALETKLEEIKLKK